MATTIDERLLEASPEWQRLKADARRAAAAAAEAERKRLAAERRRLIAEAEKLAAATAKTISERQATFNAAKVAFDAAWGELCAAKRHTAAAEGLTRQREMLERQLVELQPQDVAAFIERMDGLYARLVHVGTIQTGKLLVTFRGGIPREEPEMDPAPINEALAAIRDAKQAARQLTLDPPADMAKALAAIEPTLPKAVKDVL